MIATNLPADEITGLKEMFHAIDTDRSGTITVEELRDGLKQKGSLLPADELVAIMENADIDGDGKIDYEEFLAATMHLGKLEREEHMLKAFQVSGGLVGVVCAVVVVLVSLCVRAVQRG